MYQDLNWGAYLLATVTKVDFVCWGPGDPVTGSSWKEDLRSVELGSLVERGREGSKNLLLSPMSQDISSDPQIIFPSSETLLGASPPPLLLEACLPPPLRPGQAFLLVLRNSMAQYLVYNRFLINIH